MYVGGVIRSPGWGIDGHLVRTARDGRLGGPAGEFACDAGILGQTEEVMRFLGSGTGPSPKAGR